MCFGAYLQLLQFSSSFSVLVFVLTVTKCYKVAYIYLKNIPRQPEVIKGFYKVAITCELLTCWRGNYAAEKIMHLVSYTIR